MATNKFFKVKNGLDVGPHLELAQEGTNDRIKSTGNVLYVKANEYSFQNNSGNTWFSTDTSGNFTIAGNLTVNGTQTILNTATLDVEDKTITIGKGQTEANSGGSGIIVDGSSASILWDESNDTWDLNKPLEVSSYIKANGALYSTIGSSGGAFLVATHTGNESWSFDARSGSGSTDYVDFGISGSTRCMTWQENGNVGIGTNDPLAPLDVVRGGTTGLSSVNARTALLLQNNLSNGTVLSINAKNTGYSGIFLGDQDSEAICQIQYVHTDDKLKFFTNGGGYNPLAISGQNVGIGTDSPANTLHVKAGASGASSFDSRYNLVLEDDGENYIAIYSPTNNFGGLRFLDSSSAIKGYIDYYHGTNGDKFQIYAQKEVEFSFPSVGEQVTFKSNGSTDPIKVGIGTITPASKLHISGNSDLGDEDCMLMIDDVDGSPGSRIPAIMFRSNTSGTVTNQARIRGTDTQGMTISGSSALANDLVVQNTGIGVGTPSNHTFDSNITAYHATNAIKSQVKLWTNTADNTGTEGGAIEWVGSGDKTAVGSKIAATRVASGGKMDMRFYTGRNSDSDHEKMRIHSDGNISIGNTTASNGRLSVTGFKSSAGDLWTQVGPNNNLSLIIQNTAPVDNTNACLYFGNNSGVKAAINARFISQTTEETQLRFSTTDSSGGSYERMYLSGDGKLGIGMGVSNPAQMIEIATSGFAYMRTRSTSGSYTGFDIGQHSNSNIYLNNRDNSSIIFQTNNAPRAAIDSSGNFLTGGTSNDSSASMGGQTPVFFANGYASLGGLRVNGSDGGNTLYRSGGDIAINSATHNVQLKAPSGAIIAANRFNPAEHVIFTSNTGYLQFPSTSGGAWAMASHSGSSAGPGTQGTDLSFHKWNGSAWKRRMYLEQNGELVIETDARGLVLSSYGGVQGSHAYNTLVAATTGGGPNSGNSTSNIAQSLSVTSMADTGFKTVAILTTRAGTIYLNVKTNITANNVMYLAEFIGYNYGYGNKYMYNGGYTYNTGSSLTILNNFSNTVFSTNPSNSSVGAYRASDGALCFKLYMAHSGYTEGKMVFRFHSHNVNTTRSCQVVASQIRNDGTDHFA